MVQTIVQGHEVFEYDTYLHLMPQLLNAGFRPMGISGFMRSRLEAISSGDSWQKDYWLSSYLDSGDGAAYSGGKVKVVLGSDNLRRINDDSELRSGALVVSDGDYGNLEGEEFSRSQLGMAGIEKLLSKKQVRDHPVWKALAGDSHLLSEYAGMIFSEMNEQYGFDEGMGIYLASEQEVPTMRSWVVGTLHQRSDARSFYNLNNYSLTRLVGVRAEAAMKKTH